MFSRQNIWLQNRETCILLLVLHWFSVLLEAFVLMNVKNVLRIPSFIVCRSVALLWWQFACFTGKCVNVGFKHNCKQWAFQEVIGLWVLNGLQSWQLLNFFPLRSELWEFWWAFGMSWSALTWMTSSRMSSIFFFLTFQPLGTRHHHFLMRHCCCLNQAWLKLLDLRLVSCVLIPVKILVNFPTIIVRIFFLM